MIVGVVLHILTKITRWWMNFSRLPWVFPVRGVLFFDGWPMISVFDSLGLAAKRLDASR